MPKAKKKSPPSKPGNRPASAMKVLATDELPLLLRDSQNRIIAGIKLETLQLTGDKLRLTGWTIGSARLALLCANARLQTELKRFPRKDVLQNLAVACDFDPGFELTATLPPIGEVVLRWVLDGKKPQDMDFALKVERATDSPTANTAQLGSPSVAVPAITNKGMDPTGDIECAFRLGNGLVLVGWLEETRFGTASLHLHRGKSMVDVYALTGSTACRTLRVFRPDIAELLRLPEGHLPKLGFACWIPFAAEGAANVKVGFTRSITEARSLTLLTPSQHSTEQELLLERYGFPLAELADELRDEQWLSWFESRGYGLYTLAEERMGAIDQAYVINGRALLLHGWVAAGNADIETLVLKRANGANPIDILPRLTRVYRPDIFAAWPQLAGESLGFIALVDEAELVTLEPLSLVLRTQEGRATIAVKPEPTDTSDLFTLLNSAPVLIDPVTELVQSNAALQAMPGLHNRYNQFLRRNFRSRNAGLSHAVQDERTLMAAVDRTFNLGEAGLLLFGWYFVTGRKKLVSISLHGTEGLLANITGTLFPLMRLDVSGNLRARYPDISDYCGFCCHVAVPTKPGEARSLRFRLEDNIDVWLRLDTSKPDKEQRELAKEIFNYLPHTDRITQSLFHLYQSTLGAPLEALSRRKPVGSKLQERILIGEQAAKPIASLIMVCSDAVQLRQFCCHLAKDEDLGAIELIVVCINPITATELAATARYCCDLFSLSAMVLVASAPLEIAEACNAAAALAKAPLLLFIEEGMIPSSTTLVRTLKEKLDSQKSLAAVGAHAALYDGTPLHFGVAARPSTGLPGFMLAQSIHTRPRTTGNTSLLATELLMSPCRAIRKRNFEACGGLDTRFFNVDIAWQALSLQLTASGSKLAIDTDAAVWQRNFAARANTTVRTPGDFLYYFDVWLATGLRSKQPTTESGT